MWPGLTGNRNNGPERAVLPIYFSATRAGDGGEAGREREREREMYPVSAQSSSLVIILEGVERAGDRRGEAP